MAAAGAGAHRETGQIVWISPRGESRRSPTCDLLNGFLTRAQTILASFP